MTRFDSREDSREYKMVNGLTTNFVSFVKRWREMKTEDTEKLPRVTVFLKPLAPYSFS